MKRPWNLTDFFRKKPKLEPDEPELAVDDAKPPEANPTQPGENSRSIEADLSEIERSLPECWTMVQYHYFKQKYDGLVVSNRKLGCEFCLKHDFGEEKGVHVSKEWTRSQIVAAGTTKEIQQSSLRKKMKQHFSSKAHIICRDNIKHGEQEGFMKAAGKVPEKYLTTTCRVFNTVYSLAQRCKPFSDIEDEIALQIKNGLDMGIGLHSRTTAVKIVGFIAREIKNGIFAKIIEKGLKICLIVDEASTISRKPVVIFFIKVEGSIISPTIFVDLIELERQDAETIFRSVLRSLDDAGLTREYLEENLVGFCSDGNSLMLGRSSGVSGRIAREFPNVENLSRDSCAVSDSIQKAKNIVRTIAVGSVEAERGFSKMNFICSEKRNRLTVSNIANVMTVSLIGLPLKDWDPVPAVKKWLQKHHTADDARFRQNRNESEEDANQVAIWSYLK